MAEIFSATGERELREALKAWKGFEAAPVEYLSVGLINRTWSVGRGSRQFIAQHINDVFSPHIQKNIKLVSTRLRERGLAAPRLLETMEGALFVELPDGSRWRLMEKLPGVSFRRCESTEQARSAFVYLAVFMNCLLDFVVVI